MSLSPNRACIVLRLKSRHTVGGRVLGCKFSVALGVWEGGIMAFEGVFPYLDMASDAFNCENCRIRTRVCDI
jgi:hypothetical protein